MSQKIVIILDDLREINLELYEEFAPLTVKNFLKLVDSKFYDKVCFHRVIEKFMIQTGGYKLNNDELIPTKTDSIKGEFQINGFNNPIKHEIGVISMARSAAYNSASSQFFICVEACPHLDGQYAAFGKVIDEESIKVIKEISSVQTCLKYQYFNDFPVKPIIIKTIKRGNIQ